MSGTDNISENIKYGIFSNHARADRNWDVYVQYLKLNKKPCCDYHEKIYKVVVESFQMLFN